MGNKNIEDVFPVPLISLLHGNDVQYLKNIDNILTPFSKLVIGWDKDKYCTVYIYSNDHFLCTIMMVNKNIEREALLHQALIQTCSHS